MLSAAFNVLFSKTERYLLQNQAKFVLTESHQRRDKPKQDDVLARRDTNAEVKAEIQTSRYYNQLMQGTQEVRLQDKINNPNIISVKPVKRDRHK